MSGCNYSESGLSDGERPGIRRDPFTQRRACLIQGQAEIQSRAASDLRSSRVTVKRDLTKFGANRVGHYPQRLSGARCP